MKGHIRSKTLFILLVPVIISVVSCTPNEEWLGTFMGPKDAVNSAVAMFESIGGLDKWCALKSLYIKAEHTQPEMEIPYQSEIWRAMDTFEVVIAQQNDSFHVKGVFNASEGRIHYLDDRDTFRILNTEQLKDFEYNHKHNVNVQLHQLACNPSDYHVEIDTMGRIAFYEDEMFICSFALDEMNRPFMHYHPLSDGSMTGVIFTKWATDDGLVRSGGGHPLDSTFQYRTEIWEPSKQSLEETFGQGIFELPDR